MVYVRLGFNAPNTPEYVSLMYQRFDVKAYISKPWQCYRCQKFRHNARDCRLKVCCVVCSGPYSVHNSKINNIRSLVKCSNCQGNHTASYGGCPYIKEAKVIDSIRFKKKLSYRKAVTRVSQGKSGALKL